MNYQSPANYQSPNSFTLQSDIQQFYDLLNKVKLRLERMSPSGPSESFQSHLELLDAESLIDNTANPVFKDSFLDE